MNIIAQLTLNNFVKTNLVPTGAHSAYMHKTY